MKNIDVDKLIEISKSDLNLIPLSELEVYFWEFYPHEISWSEVPYDCREALKKIGRVLIQNAKLKPTYLKS
jgi:hypothetical protein